RLAEREVAGAGLLAGGGNGHRAAGGRVGPSLGETARPGRAAGKTPTPTGARGDRPGAESGPPAGGEGQAPVSHPRGWPPAGAPRRLAEIRQILDDDRLDAAAPIRESDARGGYRDWSSSYDAPDNQIIALEQPEVWSLLDSNAPGRALDAACGTGRHAAHLA